MGKPAMTPMSMASSTPCSMAWMELLGDDPLLDLRGELELAVARHSGRTSRTTWPYCPLPPTLLEVLLLAARRLAHRFVVGYLGLAHIGRDLEITDQPVNNDFQVQFAHPGNDRLAGVVGDTGFNSDLPWQFCQRFLESLIGRGQARFDGRQDPGSGNSMVSSTIECLSSHRVSPVETSFRPTVAAMSPE